MTRHAARRFADSLLVLSMFLLAACGSGGVSGPAVTTGALAISPATATVYTGVPAKFVVTGGTAPYFITSSNAAVLPVPGGAYNYNELTLIPNEVGADTVVTVSATDAKNSTSVSSTVTVQPRTVSNVVTVTPSATCSGALCAGSDAQVSAVLTQNGVPLVGRTVQFTVVSGPLGIVTSSNGSVAVLSPTGSAVTDSNGRATVTVRAFNGVALQTALLDITDLASGSTVRTAITIAPPASPTPAALAAQPATVAFQGSQAGQCAQGGSADVIIFGGTPPYQISQPASFNVFPNVVASSGGRFTVQPTGTCVDSAQVAIVDANGASTTITLSNTVSTNAAASAVTVAPPSVRLTSCSDVANVVITGGNGFYLVSARSGPLVATVQGDSSSGGTGSIQLAPHTASAAPLGAGPYNVAFSDGRTSATVSVTLTGAALSGCP